MQVLVIGGTGPTGPHVVNGLIAAGCTVTILHTGRHEVDDIPSLGDGPARDILQNIVTFAGKIGTPITRTASTGGKIGSTGA